eukprot:3435122-Pyramimonas_sp.AAC.1
MSVIWILHQWMVLKHQSKSNITIDLNIHITKIVVEIHCEIDSGVDSGDDCIVDRETGSEVDSMRSIERST